MVRGRAGAAFGGVLIERYLSVREGQRRESGALIRTKLTTATAAF